MTCLSGPLALSDVLHLSTVLLCSIGPCKHGGQSRACAQDGADTMLAVQG